MVGIGGKIPAVFVNPPINSAGWGHCCGKMLSVNFYVKLFIGFINVKQIQRHQSSIEIYITLNILSSEKFIAAQNYLSFGRSLRDNQLFLHNYHLICNRHLQEHTHNCNIQDCHKPGLHLHNL